MTAVICSKCGSETDPARRGMCNRCYEGHRYRMNAYGQWTPDRVDAEPVRQHVRALIDAGVPSKKIARSAAISNQLLAVLLRGRPGGQPSKRVSHATAEALLAVTAPEPVGDDFMPAIGAQRRLCALVTSGWTITALAEQLGVGTRSDLCHLMYRQKLVRAWKHQQIAELYGRLQLTPGPSEKARQLGQRRGWPLPFQWNEDAIDDPNRGPTWARREHGVLA